MYEAKIWSKKWLRKSSETQALKGGRLRSFLRWGYNWVQVVVSVSGLVLMVTVGGKRMYYA